MTLGQRIRQAREQRGLTVEWLAKHSGISRPHLSDMERGKCSGIAGPGVLTVQAIAGAMSMTVSELLGEVPQRCARALGCFDVQRRK
jgi:transcriptional regulator with XRE-family HTH domain